MTDTSRSTPSGWDPFAGDVGPRRRRGALARAAVAVLRIGPLRWLTAQLIPFGCLAIGAVITSIRPDYALVGVMIGFIPAPVLGFVYLYKTLGASAHWLIPLGLSTMALSVFGSAAVSDMLLAQRGQPTETVINYVARHSGGGWDCTFTPLQGTPTRSTLQGCDAKLNAGDHVTLILDPLGQISPVPAPFRANPVANPVFGLTSTAVLILVIAGATANGEYWIRHHPKTWTLYEQVIVKRGTSAYLWLRR